MINSPEKLSSIFTENYTKISKQTLSAADAVIVIPVNLPKDQLNPQLRISMIFCCDFLRMSIPIPYLTIGSAKQIFLA